MDWAEDLKFSFKKSAAKKGRRAAASSTPTTSSSQQSPEESLDLDLDLSAESTAESNTKVPPRRRISGGWADSGNRSARSRGKNLFEEERFSTKTKSIETTDDDIPVIPDLDDIQDELLMNEVVDPPSVSVNRVVTLKELNSDLLKQNAFSSLEDVDLSILTKYLQPEIALEEPDEVWEWDQVFTEVTAEIHSEKSPLKSTGEELQEAWDISKQDGFTVDLGQQEK